MRIFVAILAVLLVLPSAQAGTITVTNSGAILIPGSGTSGNASPYPSIINVSGMTGVLTGLTVTFNSLSHAWPDDIDILLVAPGGSLASLLMSDAGGGNDLVGVSITLDDAAASPLPDSA